MLLLVKANILLNKSLAHYTKTFSEINQMLSTNGFGQMNNIIYEDN